MSRLRILPALLFLVTCLPAHALEGDEILRQVDRKLNPESYEMYRKLINIEPDGRKKELAGKLLARARSLDRDPAGRYVALELARKIASEAGTTGTVNGIPVRTGMMLAGEPGAEARFVVDAGWESITFLLPPQSRSAHT